MSIAEGAIAELPIARANEKAAGSGPPPRRTVAPKSDELAAPEPR